MSSNTRKVYIENENGELELIDTLADNQEVIKRTIPTAKQRTFLDNNDLLHNLEKKLGGYVHLYYIKQDLLFNNINIDRASISRFLYLCTYIDYNTNQANLLVLKKGSNIIPMTKNDVKRILGLGKTAFNDFYREMLNNELIFEANNKIYLSNEYVTKGTIENKKKDFTRLFIDPVRHLYEHCTPRQHKQLSYVLQLAPFLDYNNNFITIDNKVADIKDVMELLGLSTDSKNAISTFRNNMLKFHIEYGGNKYYLFASVTIRYAEDEREVLAINPRVLWAGYDIECNNAIFNQLLIKE